MKTINGILMVAFTAMFYLFCGCSQDDDGYNNSDMYTLAEEMETRGGGGDPGGIVKKRKIIFSPSQDHLQPPSKTVNSTDPILDGE